MPSWLEDTFGGGTQGAFPEEPPQWWTDYTTNLEQGSNRRFDETLGEQAAARKQAAKQAKASLDFQYAQMKQNARTQQEQVAADRWYKEQSIALAGRQFEETQRQFNLTFPEQQRQFTATFGEGQRQFNERLGFDERKFQEDVRRFGLQQAIAEAGLTGMYNGLPTIEKQKFEEDIRRFGLNHALNEAQVTGYYNGQATLGREQFEQGRTEQDRRFAVDLAKTATDISSRPDMVFQYQNQFVPRIAAGYLQGALTGPTPRGTGTPQGQTIEGTLRDVGYLGAMPGAGGTTHVDPTLTAIGSAYERGFDKFGAQTLEGLDPNDRAMLASGGTYLGYDPEREARKYSRSRLGQAIGA